MGQPFFSSYDAEGMIGVRVRVAVRVPVRSPSLPVARPAMSVYDSSNADRLSEDYIQNSFHSYLKSSLTQAKAEKLLGADVLSSAEGDLMITGAWYVHTDSLITADVSVPAGPALCLYFAALRSTTNPPSVPLPRHHKSAPPLELSPANCPPAFVSFLQVWSNNVPAIQSMAPEYQHDLARLICNLEPQAQPPNPSLNAIAADLRSVAIAISQRRSFQDRFAADLQAALDAGEESSSRKYKASFVPPPVYDPSPSPSPVSSVSASPASPTAHLPSSSSLGVPPRSPGLLTANPWPPRTPSPTLFTPDSPAIDLIRETLYASLADVIDRTRKVRTLLQEDPPRAYFAAVALAVLEVATTSMTAEGGVVGVLGKELTLAECPPELRPFMIELGAIGREAQAMEEEDNATAMALAAREESDANAGVLGRLDRVRGMLEDGTGTGRRSIEGRTIGLANRINALSLGLTRLRPFRERQAEVFAVLSGVK